MAFNIIPGIMGKHQTTFGIGQRYIFAYSSFQNLPNTVMDTIPSPLPPKPRQDSNHPTIQPAPSPRETPSDPFPDISSNATAYDADDESTYPLYPTNNTTSATSSPVILPARPNRLSANIEPNLLTRFTTTAPPIFLADDLTSSATLIDLDASPPLPSPSPGVIPLPFPPAPAPPPPPRLLPPPSPSAGPAALDLGTGCTHSRLNFVAPTVFSTPSAEANDGTGNWTKTDFRVPRLMPRPWWRPPARDRASNRPGGVVVKEEVQREWDLLLEEIWEGGGVWFWRLEVEEARRRSA
ncbi:hypothetical protein B0T18DRAFT_393113 [Schizothecium vesticola]|uniref:Uncharacterized protein n=1 Tax=Schizothecium vesticola TaxID=314040 RepID=A0AA40JYL2_9PEZI|nr:hypothetical protein B0T18DRAFT_393113 [Schizothecium vesticola]